MTAELVPALIVVWITVVVVPLAIRAVDEHDRTGRRPRLLEAVRASALPAAALLCLPMALRPGRLAFALALPWLAVCVVAAVFGLGRIVRRGLVPISELAIDAGFVYLAIGSVWTVAWRAGGPFFGFASPWVLLTAVHFYVAGFALATAAGVIARRRTSGRLAKLSAAAVIVGVPLTAVGIATTPEVEIAAGVLLSVGAMGVGVQWLMATRRRGPIAAVAGGCLLASMPLALLYLAVGDRFQFAELTSIEIMEVTHGLLNGLGFATAAFVSLYLRPIRANAPEGSMPVSALTSSGRVGADFFARRHLLAAGDARGLVDRLAHLSHPGFDATRVDPAIRAFYERTSEHELFVRPSWRRGFRIGARVVAAIARRVEQLGLPLAAEPDGERIASAILSIDAAADGRSDARAWVRTYADSGRAMYVAVYATHRYRGVAYLNIAFPLPGSNLTSVLRPDPIEGGRGLVLTTSNPRPGEGDAGIWWVMKLAGRLWRIRLPLRETIHVWTPTMASAPRDLVEHAPAEASLVARHQLWLFGVRYLTLDYTMRWANLSVMEPSAPADVAGASAGGG